MTHPIENDIKNLVYVLMKKTGFLIFFLLLVNTPLKLGSGLGQYHNQVLVIESKSIWVDKWHMQN